MFGIPTVQFDYTNNPEIFDPNSFKFDPETPREKTLYNLRKAMLAAYKAKGISASVAEDVISRNADQILDSLLNPVPQAYVSANATVIKGTPTFPEKTVASTLDLSLADEPDFEWACGNGNPDALAVFEAKYGYQY